MKNENHSKRTGQTHKLFNWKNQFELVILSKKYVSQHCLRLKSSGFTLSQVLGHHCGLCSQQVRSPDLPSARLGGYSFSVEPGEIIMSIG